MVGCLEEAETGTEIFVSLSPGLSSTRSWTRVGTAKVKSKVQRLTFGRKVASEFLDAEKGRAQKMSNC